MPAVKFSFIGASGAQYLCELYNPTIHVGMPKEAGIMVFATGPRMAPGFLWAQAVDDLSHAFRYEAREAIKEQHPQTDLWFCVRADESSQTRQRAAADLAAGRR